MKHFAGAMFSDQEDSLTCHDCKAQLAEYVDAQVMGVESGKAFAEVELHLQVCPHCAREYRELLALTESAYAEDLPQPARQPKFDFSFLEAGSKRFVWWDELGRLIIEFSAELVRAFQPPAPRLGYAGVKSEKPQRTLCQLPVQDPDEDLEVTITAEEARDDPNACTVVVEVNIPSLGGWPNLSGTEVTLKRDEQELESQATDAFGKAVFEGVSTDDLPHLVFEIKPHRETENSTDHP